MTKVEMVEEIKGVEDALEKEETLTIIAIIVKSRDIHKSVVGSYVDV